MIHRAPALARSLLVLSCLVGLGACGAGDHDARTTPAPFLEEWQQSEDARLFPGAELYGHINGGAEVFLEMGFEDLVVQSYHSDHGRLDLELYRMSDPTAALGIYLMKCGTEQPDLRLEARHTVNPYQLQMVHNDLYVIVNAVQLESDAAGTLTDFARTVSGGLPRGQAVDPFGELPTEGRISGSERVVRGPFTLEPLVTLGDGDILQLGGSVTAVAAQYEHDGESRFTRIVVPYPNEATAERAFRHLVANLDSYLELIESDDSRLVFRDYAGALGEVLRDGARLRIRIHLAAPPP
jgi:hypothetical protein